MMRPRSTSAARDLVSLDDKVIVTSTGKLTITVVGHSNPQTVPWVPSLLYQWIRDSSDAKFLDSRVLTWIKTKLYCQMVLNAKLEKQEQMKVSLILKSYQEFPVPLVMDEVVCLTPRMQYLLDGLDFIGLECMVEGSLILQLWRPRQTRFLIRGGYTHGGLAVDLQMLRVRLAMPRFSQSDILHAIANQEIYEANTSSVSEMGHLSPGRDRNF